MQAFDHIINLWDNQQTILAVSTIVLFALGFLLLHVTEDRNIKNQTLEEILAFFIPVSFLGAWGCVIVAAYRLMSVDISAISLEDADPSALLEMGFWEATMLIVVLLFIGNIVGMIMMGLLGSITKETHNSQEV